MGSTRPLAVTLRRFVADLPILAGISVVAIIVTMPPAIRAGTALGDVLGLE